MNRTHDNRKPQIVTLPDILLGVWILYSALRSCSPSFEWARFYPYGCIMSIYLLARYFRHRSYILFVGIVCVGFWQSSLAIGQHFHWFESNHLLFDITGSFGNPGQLGGFLAISIISTICMWIRSKKKRYAALLLLPVLLQVYALLLSNSRSGWLAVMSGVVALCVLQRKCIWNAKRWLFISFLSVIVIGGLYKYKPQSANGRILVWKVTMNMIAEKPIFGHGPGGFNENYMYYQADYFTEDPKSPYMQYSDNIAYPYNELLHIWTEQGIIGLLLLLALLIAVLKIPAKNYVCKATIIGYMVFAQFSYPSYVPGLLILFPILLASIQNEPLEINVNSPIRWCAAILTLGLLGCTFVECTFRQQCRKTIPQLFSSSTLKASYAKAFAENHYRRLLNYPRMADIYGQYVYAFGKTEYAIGILNDLKRIVPTSELYCDLGDLYKSENKWKQALECYGTAHAMIPRRLTPVYKSFIVYCEIGDTISAQQQAAKVLSIPVQVENTRTLRMKAEIKRYLDKANGMHLQFD